MEVMRLIDDPLWATDAISEVDLSSRALHCLHSIDVTTVGDLYHLVKAAPAWDVMAIPGVGRKTYIDMCEAVGVLPKRINTYRTYRRRYYYTPGTP